MRKINFEATIFTIDFNQAANENALPELNDVYSIRFRRSFIEADSMTFKVSLDETVNEDYIKKVDG